MLKKVIHMINDYATEVMTDEVMFIGEESDCAKFVQEFADKHSTWDQDEYDDNEYSHVDSEGSYRIYLEDCSEKDKVGDIVAYYDAL